MPFFKYNLRYIDKNIEIKYTIIYGRKRRILPKRECVRQIYTQHQLKTIQKIEYNLAYRGYTKICVYSFIGD